MGVGFSVEMKFFAICETWNRDDDYDLNRRVAKSEIFLFPENGWLA